MRTKRRFPIGHQQKIIDTSTHLRFTRKPYRRSSFLKSGIRETHRRIEPERKSLRPVRCEIRRRELAKRPDRRYHNRKAVPAAHPAARKKKPIRWSENEAFLVSAAVRADGGLRFRHGRLGAAGHGQEMCGPERQSAVGRIHRRIGVHRCEPEHDHRDTAAHHRQTAAAAGEGVEHQRRSLAARRRPVERPVRRPRQRRSRRFDQPGRLHRLDQARIRRGRH